MSQLLIKVPFSGFYNSVHDAYIDYELERFIDDDHGDTDPDIASELFDHTPHTAIYEAYAKEYVKWFNKAFKDESNLDLQLIPEKLFSPKYYNFETDRMFAYIDSSHIKTLAMNTDPDILDSVIKSRFTSCDGFRSHYDNSLYNDEWYEVPVDEWDHNMLETLLTAYMQTHGIEIDEDDITSSAYCDGKIRELIEATIPSDDEFWNIVDKAYRLNYGDQE